MPNIDDMTFQDAVKGMANRKPKASSSLTEHDHIQMRQIALQTALSISPNDTSVLIEDAERIYQWLCGVTTVDPDNTNVGWKMETCGGPWGNPDKALKVNSAH